jgi:anaerobic magnesium-protoporphyrin IX monomethyl ester cyclase
MTDVVITHSYFLKFDPKQWKAMQPYPPLGTLYAVSMLRQANIPVHFFDTMFANAPDEIEAVLQQEKPAIFVIYDDCFNYLTKMCLSNMRYAAFDMIQLAKSYGCAVIVSSSDATDNVDLYIRQGADFVIIGEGEITLKELTSALVSDASADCSIIEGIAYKTQDNIVHHTSKRHVMHELDQIPTPAWDVVEVEAYKSRWIKKHGYFSLNMVTTRGCPYKCNWCAKPIYGNRYNTHSAARIVTELEQLMHTFQPDHIWFCDDIFGLKPEWLKTFATLVEEKGLTFTFKIQSRADLLVQEENVHALARAGCSTVWIGTESGSQKILDAMDKGIALHQIYTATRLLKKYRIAPCFFLQFGYPGETYEDIESTINLVTELLPEDIGISVSYPLPGTKFYDNVKNELKLKSNWVDSDDLDLMFKNMYMPGFYKRLHRYVHKTYRQHQASFYVKNVLNTSHIRDPFYYKRIAALPYYFIMSGIEKYRMNKLKIPS